VTDENRRRLIALVTASTKLRAATDLAREATIDLARAGLQREPVQKLAAEIDVFVERITFAINEEIPST
jgi:hypothetical protein